MIIVMVDAVDAGVSFLRLLRVRGLILVTDQCKRFSIDSELPIRVASHLVTSLKKLMPPPTASDEGATPAPSKGSVPVITALSR